MATRRTGALIAVVFVTALVAGGAAGMLMTRYLAPTKPPVQAGELPLSEALGLSSSQRDQIRQIWEDFRSINVKSYGEEDMLKHLEDDDILKMLNPDQQKELAGIHQKYKDQSLAIEAKRKLAFNDAVDRTKQLLNDDQRRRYDEILARRMGPDRSTGPSGPTTTRPSAESPAASVNFPSSGG